MAKKNPVTAGEQITNEKENLQTEIEELTNRWKRALADYQNLEKRYEREKSDFVQFANTNLILRLLTVLDHFQRAQDCLKDPGLDLAIKEFKRVLSEEGMEEVEAVGKDFDPVEMEAIETVVGKEDGKVIEELNKGYKLKGKIIRPAKVKVGKIVNG